MTSPAIQPSTGAVDIDRITELYTQLLYAIGENPGRDGLKDTPRRVAAWWKEFLDHDPGRTDTVFGQEVTEGSDQLVVVRGITAWSLCEHHLLPMFLQVTVGYRPAGQVLGLSKFARIVADHAHRLQLQERLVDGVATDVIKATGSWDVGVVAEGEHLCMSMRGVRAEQARTLNHSFHGGFVGESPLGTRLLMLARPDGSR